MERIPRAIYTKELREEAVKLVEEGGLSIPEVGRRLSVSPSTIRYWVKANKEASLRKWESSRGRLPRWRWSLPG